MKALFIGGVKSGKSYHAERYVLKLEGGKPFYMATSEPLDDEMRLRIECHQQQRADNFETIEEPLRLVECIGALDAPVLVECMTLWMNNMLYHGYTAEDVVIAVDQLLELENDIVFVQNDVGSGVIPDNPLARKFADISGIVAQRLAGSCDEVYHCIAGIATKIK